MRYAISNNERIEAQKGLSAVCPICGQPVIARCGNIKIRHWAHVSGSDCDSWQSPMSEWHYSWQDKFPKECREYKLLKKKTNECHIADILTPPNLKESWIVIEFQHSSIKSEEREAREQFYKHLIWVVDGTRSKNSSNRIKNIFDYLQRITDDCFLALSPEVYLPKAWLNSNVPVVFDFAENLPFLLCIFPIKFLAGQGAICISKDDFIAKAQNGNLRSYLIERMDILKKAKSKELITAFNQIARLAASPMRPGGFQEWQAKQAAKRRGPKFS